MKLENNYLKLELTNKGGEMSSLFYKGYDILYKGDGEYWSGKNPTLFPIISSPDSKEYILNNHIYPIKNHGLIRYATLNTIKENDDEVIMELNADEETLKQYPFNFHYEIKYQLENNKVLISYLIKNNDNKEMPFTFGLHPGFNVKDFNEASFLFDNERAQLITDSKTNETKDIILNDYKTYLEDISKYQTVILKNIKANEIIFKQKEYTIKVDFKESKYLALWTPDPKANFICIEPWLSCDNIKQAINPFDTNKYELHILKPNEEFRFKYYVEVL